MIRTGKVRPTELVRRRDAIRIGFVPLCDAAPIIMAYELGLFAARGLQVELSREVGWATIRDKIVFRELEAAHAPAAMVLGISLGLGAFKSPCLTGLVLNLNGNGITLSNRLWEAGVRDGKTLREFIAASHPAAPLTFGIAFSSSSHHFLLQSWLRHAGIDPDRHVNIVVVPPPQMTANLKAGHLDGYCVGEPWNSSAVRQKAGWVMALSPELMPLHPEKVLLARTDFAEARPEEHRELIAALYEACAFCHRRENRPQLIKTLSSSRYLNLGEDALSATFLGPFRFHKDRTESVPDLHVFSGPGVNEPGLEKAVWTRESLTSTRLLPDSLRPDRPRLLAMFRADIFHSATAIEAREKMVVPG